MAEHGGKPAGFEGERWTRVEIPPSLWSSHLPELWCPCLLSGANAVCLVNCHGDRLGNAESIQPSPGKCQALIDDSYEQFTIIIIQDPILLLLPFTVPQAP